MKKTILLFFMVIMGFADQNFDNLRDKALKGDSKSQLELGNLYFFGESAGGLKDIALAVRWYRKAAEQGNGSAFFNLGICYDRGLGVENNKDKALIFYLKAARSGVVQAYINAGVFYRDSGNLEEAMKYFKLSANSGNAAGARLYALQCEAIDSCDQAFIFMKQGALGGDLIAMVSLADYYESGKGCVKQLDQTVFWLQKASDKNNTEALVKLAFCYGKGVGVDRDIKKSTILFQQAAELDESTGMVEYGKILFTKKQDTKALHLFQKSAKKGNCDAEFFIGVCYALGRGVEKNVKVSFLHFEEAAKAGHTKAQFNTALCFENGDGIDQSDNMAFYWYEKAADKEDVSAMVSLAEFYYFGVGTEKNHKYARELLEKAIKLGSKDAKNVLDDLFNCK